MKERGINRNKIKIFLGMIILGVIIVLSIMNNFSRKGLIIKEYDNYYNENNIVLFYEDKNSDELKNLDAEYGITEYVNGEVSEFDKVLKSTNIIHSIVEKDGIKDTELTSGYQILKKKDGAKKVSFRDMAIIARDIINATGVISRIGVFRKATAQFDSDYEYYVIEYWSTEYSKWVMIDFLDQGYFCCDDTKLSALEVFNGDLKNMPYLGNTSQKDYKNKFNKYRGSYSVDIENSSTNLRSNCYISYVKNEKAIALKFNNKLNKPTIYTTETSLFEKSPFERGISTDQKTYLLVYLSKFVANGGLLKGNEEQLLIAAFNQDKTIKDFYININDSGYEKVEYEKEITISKGTTKIELSLDGEKTESYIILEKN